MQLPRKQWQVVAGGPAGRDTLLVIVTDTPRDLSGLAAETSGPFMKTLLDARGRSQLQSVLVNGTPGAACAAGTASPPAQDLSCSDAYGSALLNIDEVR